MAGLRDDVGEGGWELESEGVEARDELPRLGN